MLAAVILVLQAQRSDFLLVFHPPQAPCKFFSSSTSSSLISSPPRLLSSVTLDSRPFHPPASHLAWKTRTAPSHTRLICPTSLDMWLLNLFSCVCVCVCVCLSHTLWCFSPLPVIILPLLYPLSAVGGLRTLSLSLSGAVSGSQKGAATGHGDNGGGPYRSDSVKSMVTEGVKAGRWQTVQGHMQSGGLRPSE